MEYGFKDSVDCEDKLVDSSPNPWNLVGGRVRFLFTWTAGNIPLSRADRASRYGMRETRMFNGYATGIDLYAGWICAKFDSGC